MTVTGKHTRYAMECWLFIPKRRMAGLLPPELSPFGSLGLGAIIVGAWDHADAYVDDRSYGPVLEAWVATGVVHEGTRYGYSFATYNNSPSYSEPVNNVFKFNKEQAEIRWSIKGQRHEVEVIKDGVPVLRMRGRPTPVPAPVPFSNPRTCWLPKGDERYVARMTITPRRSRLAFCSAEIQPDGPLGEVARSLIWVAKYSVIYEDASIKIPEPERYR